MAYINERPANSGRLQKTVKIIVDMLRIGGMRRTIGESVACSIVRARSAETR
jgi:hypothetical protein